MNTSRPTLFVRCTLWMGALFAAAAVSAGPAEDVKEADVAFQAGDVSTAMSLLRKAADQDHPLAQARLGDLLRAAEFESEAIVFYKKAADKGEPAGEVGLARALADGAGIKKDPAQALELYRRPKRRTTARPMTCWPAPTAPAPSACPRTWKRPRRTTRRRRNWA
ncbi:tetratricopeptide repeat protein [Ramlibacter montanisoli]|uniref:Sel1 repeat family protein n=1 Tax=Ramlibacter montanisoli TaxID=2732512 RepID=A0A849KEN5_9BURK|nr:SEL1-like repeat protein [Ramlibacter montanisoli]NNU43936.1 sel1 repeat family protein [Ramlibacter montanisoli]